METTKITWHSLPQDRGQIIVREWAASPSGAICRTYDRGGHGRLTYRLHRWLRSGEFEPWNGTLGCYKRGLGIARADADRLLGASRTKI